MKREDRKHAFVNTREFMREFTRITDHPKFHEYTVVRHGKPIGTYVPHRARGRAVTKKYMNFSDLEAVRFRSGTKNLSGGIDRIVYGA